MVPLAPIQKVWTPHQQILATIFLRLMLLLFCLLGSGCQLGYLFHVSYNHLALKSHEVSLETALNSNELSAEQKRKIILASEVRQYSFDQLGLKKSKNYSTFVDLKRPSVTYAVMASYKWRLEPYLWNFPIIGKAPYKGYYDESMAKAEAEKMKLQDFDVYVRGISAFSTLGKLNDPILSSMLNYSDHDLVDTIIHELTHSTLFIKSNIDFNERLAVFVASKGTEQFYLYREGINSPTLQKIKDENEDDFMFSQFITEELTQLKTWFTDVSNSKADAFEKLTPQQKEEIRQQQFERIKLAFNEKIAKKLKTNSYAKFTLRPLNNAILSNYHTYMKNLEHFERAFQKSGSSIAKFLERCKELSSSDDPEKEMGLW